jgi:hypothetical protein
MGTMSHAMKTIPDREMIERAREMMEPNKASNRAGSKKRPLTVFYQMR